MSEIYSTSGSQRYYSSREIREIKKKTLQSYKKIHTIKQISDKEKTASSLAADRDLENFIHKLP